MNCRFESFLGIPYPDGRPLYQYKISEKTSKSMTIYLKARVSPSGFENREDEALFVLYASEWFRREYQGGPRRWSDVGAPFGLDLSQQDWRALADRGLSAWQLQPLRIHGVTHRLLSLARQGGFPVAAVNENGRWVTTYLKCVVGMLLAEDDLNLDIAFEAAKRTWCDSSIILAFPSPTIRPNKTAA